MNLSVAGSGGTHVDSANVLQWHTEIDAYLATTGVAATVVRPTTFTDFMVKLAAKFVRSDAWGGLAGAGRVALIDTRDVARVFEVILTDGPQRHAGKIYDISGPTAVTMDELAGLHLRGVGNPRRVSRPNRTPAARRAAICRGARTARRYPYRDRRPHPQQRVCGALAHRFRSDWPPPTFGQRLGDTNTSRCSPRPPHNTTG